MPISHRNLKNNAHIPYTIGHYKIRKIIFSYKFFCGKLQKVLVPNIEEYTRKSDNEQVQEDYNDHKLVVLEVPFLPYHEDDRGALEDR